MYNYTLNIQMFGTDLKGTNTATFGKRLSEAEAHKYYDMTLKDAIYEAYTWEKYFDIINLPKNHGKTYSWRASGKMVTNSEPVLEGVQPDEDQPMETYEYTTTLNSFGGYIRYTDELDLFSIDPETTRLQRNQGYAVGEVFQDKAYEIMLSSKNRWFAGATITADTTLTSARNAVTGFNLDDLRKIKAFLKRQKVKGFDGGDYVILVSPEVVSSLTTLAKDNDKFTFIELMKDYKNTKPIYEGEIGRWNGFRFVEDNNIKTIATSSAGKAIHGCVILGKFKNEKGQAILKLEGKGKPETILKPLGSAGTEDPLNQIGTIGWKASGWGGFVKYSQATIIYECLADEVAEMMEDTAHETFVKGYGADGEVIEKDDVETEDYRQGSITLKK